MLTTASRTAADTPLVGRSARIEPQAILRFALLTLCVSNLVRLPVAEMEAYKAPIIMNDLMAGSVIVVGGLAMLRRRSLWIDDVTFAGLLFASVGLISALAAIPRFGLSAFQTALSLAYLARWVMYLTLYLVVVNTVRERDVWKVWGALELSMLLFAGFGIFQSIFLPNFAFLLHPDAKAYADFDPQGHRLVSTMLDPNLAAAMILCVLVIELARVANGVKVAPWKLGVLTIALLLTVSRSGLLAFVVAGGIVLAVSGISRQMVKFAALGFVLFLALLPRLIEFATAYKRLSISDPSALSRVLAWMRAIDIFLEYPWIGIGFNTWGFVAPSRGVDVIGVGSYSLDGGVLFIAVMTGIVGLALYSAMLWRIVRRCRRAWRLPAATPDERGFLIGVGALTVAMVVNALFVNSLLTPAVMEPLWVVWGLAFVIAGGIRRRAGGH